MKHQLEGMKQLLFISGEQDINRKCTGIILNVFIDQRNPLHPLHKEKLWHFSSAKWFQVTLKDFIADVASVFLYFNDYVQLNWTHVCEGLRYRVTFEKLWWVICLLAWLAGTMKVGQHGLAPVHFQKSSLLKVGQLWLEDGCKVKDLNHTEEIWKKNTAQNKHADTVAPSASDTHHWDFNESEPHKSEVFNPVVWNVE